MELKIKYKKEDIVILISKEDYERVKDLNLYYNSNSGYIHLQLGNKKTSLHRFIVGVMDLNIFVDHKNRNKLDNRRENLRTCTRSQNRMNANPYGTSKYLGVNLHISTRKYFSKKLQKEVIHKTKPKYRAAIVVNGKQRHLGLFKAEEEAAREYDKYAKIYHGEFANLNFK